MKSKQASLLHCAALLDVNECGMDWLPCTEDKSKYIELLCDLNSVELKHFLGEYYESDSPYSCQLLSVHKQMLNDMNDAGRQN